MFVFRSDRVIVRSRRGKGGVHFFFYLLQNHSMNPVQKRIASDYPILLKVQRQLFVEIRQFLIRFDVFSDFVVSRQF